MLKVPSHLKFEELAPLTDAGLTPYRGIKKMRAAGAFGPDRIDVPLFPRVSREQTFYGSFWGNNADLAEVLALAAQGKIRHTIQPIAFDQINEYVERLKAGEVVGRAVVTF